MANTLTWTLLPNGIDRTTGRARLSLVAHPALDTGSGQLAGTPLENWPALVNGLGQLQVQVLEGGQVLAAERLGTADVGSWATLFPPTTKVGEGPGDDGPFSELVGSFDYAAAHAEAAQAYATALATNPTELLRADHPVARSLAVPPPVVVPKKPLVPGETLTRIVVTSDGDGTVLRGTSERHLAPPSGSVELAERHGLLDAAFGPNATPATRAAMLAIAKRESGSFTDALVPGPGGTQVPAPGIGVAGPNGVSPVPKLSPGTPLPSGQYVFHDTDALAVPYLADFGAVGASLVPIPSEPGGAFVVSYGGRWPDVTPARLRLAADTTKAFAVTTGSVGGRAVVDVVLPPATEVDFDLASPIRGEVLDVMGDLTPTTKALAKEGQVVLLSPRQRVLSHDQVEAVGPEVHGRQAFRGAVDHAMPCPHTLPGCDRCRSRGCVFAVYSFSMTS